MNWETSNKPLVIAHRGDTTKALENTLPAMEAALKLGVDGIETDLRLTRDGEVVLFHDDDFQRLAGRKGSVETSTLAELRALRLRDGSSIPTLVELLELAAKKLLLNLEIKGFSWIHPTLEKRTLEILQKFGLKESILLSSFHPLTLWRLRRLAPEFKRGYLFEDTWLGKTSFSTLSSVIDPFSIHPPRTVVTEEFAKKYSQPIFVWTVNEEDAMEKFIRLKIHGLITDQPERLLRLLNRR